MGMFSVGRKPRKFEYKARYHDPEAEAREARRRMILGEDYARGEYVPGMYIREKRILRMQGMEAERRQQTKRTWIRSAAFLALALAVLYFMFTYFGQSFN